MHTHLFSVSKAHGSTTQISIQCEWLARMGFTPGSLVKAIPAADGEIDDINFILCNDNITSYRDLLHETAERGGKLVVVGQSSKNKIRYSTLQLVLGRKIQTCGWDSGIPLVAVYDYGIIRVRKLPKVKYQTIKSAYDNRQDKTVTAFKLQYDWLAHFGFVQGSLATATAAQGSIAIKLWDGGAEKYPEAVKHARANGSKLFQVGAHNNTPFICITGAFVENAGFAPGDIFSADCSHGRIHLQKLNLVVGASD